MVETDVGPVISVTSAPSLAASSAKANPILPLEWFPINLTGSMGSKVGPAVTKIFFLKSGRFCKVSCSINLIISSGSSILPLPYKPLAKNPCPTGKTFFTKDFNSFKLDWFAEWFIISKSIAGTT